MNQNLFVIEQDALALEQLIFESGGELTPELEAFIAEVDANLSGKADSYFAVIERFETSAELLKKKAAMYAKAAKSMLVVRERLRDRIKETMLKLGKSEISGNLIRWKLSRAQPALIIDEAVLADKWKVVVPSWVWNKELIKSTLEKEGEPIPGAELRPGWTLRDYPVKG